VSGERNEQQSQSLAELLDFLPERVTRYSISDRRISYCNHAYAVSHFATPAELIGRRLDDLLGPGELEGMHAQLARLGPDTGVLMDVVARPAPEAPGRWVAWADQYLATPNGGDVLAVGRDVTEEHLAKIALTESEARFRHLADHSADVVWRFERGDNPHFTYLSPSIEKFTGFTPAELQTDVRSFLRILADDASRTLIRTAAAGRPMPDRYDVSFRHRNGSIVIAEMQVTRLADGSQGVGRDVTEIRALQSELSELALRDPLTGLANRRLLDELLTAALHRSQRSGAEVAVIFVDLDDFKSVNDTYGHDVGDLVLQVTAERLRSSVRDADAVARVGGDEFIVVHESTTATIDGLVQRMGETMASLIDVGERGLVRCAASIGFATSRTTGHDAAALIAAADAAMYVSKKRKAQTRPGFFSSRRAG
jgi:diguanylate cyclase (GGDEF)-like protein/PAS domain S-box-containing protein